MHFNIDLKKMKEEWESDDCSKHLIECAENSPDRDSLCRLMFAMNITELEVLLSSFLKRRMPESKRAKKKFLRKLILTLAANELRTTQDDNYKSGAQKKRGMEEACNSCVESYISDILKKHNQNPGEIVVKQGRSMGKSTALPIAGPYDSYYFEDKKDSE